MNKIEDYRRPRSWRPWCCYGALKGALEQSAAPLPARLTRGAEHRGADRYAALRKSSPIAQAPRPVVRSPVVIPKPAIISGKKASIRFEAAIAMLATHGYGEPERHYAFGTPREKQLRHG